MKYMLSVVRFNALIIGSHVSKKKISIEKKKCLIVRLSTDCNYLQFTWTDQKCSMSGKITALSRIIL